MVGDGVENNNSLKTNFEGQMSFEKVQEKENAKIK